MPRLCAGERSYDVKCVVFDKDGTLLDFEQAWGRRTVNWIKAMVALVDGDQVLADRFFHALGYNVQKRQVDVNGPILSVSAEKLVTLAAGVYYAQRAIPWALAEEMAIETAWATMGTELSADEIQPLGDVRGTIRDLREAGITIAVATADNRDISLHCLKILGIDEDVALMMCGDDPLPQKPDAGVIDWIADQLDMRPGDLLMVGDSMIDMMTGRNGGAAGCVAIDPHNPAGSSPFDEIANVVLPTIAGLRVK